MVHVCRISSATRLLPPHQEVQPWAPGGVPSGESLSSESSIRVKNPASDLLHHAERDLGFRKIQDWSMRGELRFKFGPSCIRESLN